MERLYSHILFGFCNCRLFLVLTRKHQRIEGIRVPGSQGFHLGISERRLVHVLTATHRGFASFAALITSSSAVSSFP